MLQQFQCRRQINTLFCGVKGSYLVRENREFTLRKTIHNSSEEKKKSQTFFSSTFCFVNKNQAHLEGRGFLYRPDFNKQTCSFQHIEGKAEKNDENKKKPKGGKHFGNGLDLSLNTQLSSAHPEQP